MSRTQLGELIELYGEVRTFEKSDKVKEYVVFYKLPEGTQNNPKNPATFAADLKSEIPLLPPTLKGYKFTGWTNDGDNPGRGRIVASGWRSS